MYLVYQDLDTYSRFYMYLVYQDLDIVYQVLYVSRLPGP